jgi:hypothetical protein
MIESLHSLHSSSNFFLFFYTYLGRRHDGEGVHDAVGVLLADLADEESSHTGAGTTAQRVGQLEALKAVAGLGFLADNVQHGVDHLGTLGVVALGPVVTSTALSEDKVVGAEDLAKRTGTHRVHGARLEIDEDSAGHILASCKSITIRMLLTNQVIIVVN